MLVHLSSLDLRRIATTLVGQAGYEHLWLVNPQAGKIALWTRRTAQTACRSATLGVARDNLEYEDGRSEPVSRRVPEAGSGRP